MRPWLGGLWRTFGQFHFAAGKLRPREEKGVFQGHTAWKPGSQTSPLFSLWNGNNIGLSGKSGRRQRNRRESALGSLYVSTWTEWLWGTDWLWTPLEGLFWWGAHPLSCFTYPVARTTAGWGPPAPSLRRGTGSHKPLTFSLRQWQLVELLTRGIKSKQAKKSDCVKKWFKNVLCAICLATTALRGICGDRDLLLFHSRSHLGQGPQWWTLSLQVLFSMSSSLFFLLPSVSSACPHFSSWKNIFLIFPIANKVFHLQSPVHLTYLGLCCLNLVLKVKVKVIQLFVTPRTIQSMEFSRPEYWSG